MDSQIEIIQEITQLEFSIAVKQSLLNDLKEQLKIIQNDSKSK